MAPSMLAAWLVREGKSSHDPYRVHRGQRRDAVGMSTPSKTGHKRANASTVRGRSTPALRARGGSGSNKQLANKDQRANQRANKLRRATNVGLTEQEIIDRTLRLIRSEGLESLSMRRLAAELGVAPMSLYHHVRNKDELLERVIDTLLARIPTPPPRRSGWRDQLRTYGMTLIEQLTWHPGIARAVVERPPTAEGQRHVRYTGAVLVAAGFDVATAAQCLATFHTFIYGVLAAQAHLPALMATVAEKYDEPVEYSAKASARSPSSAGINQHLRKLGFRPWYREGIDSILSAIALQLRSASRARASTHARGEA